MLRKLGLPGRTVAKRGGSVLKKSNAWAELVVVPAILVIVGFVILRSLDGQWWGVLLWVLVSPLVYLGLDFLFFGRSRNVDSADANRRRYVVPTRAEPSARAAGRARPEWKAEQETSTGAEILRRGRRYDRRRA